MNTRITLKAARINMGISEAEAAQALGITIRTLRNWESGITSPSCNYAVMISKLYRISISHIDFSEAANAGKAHELTVEEVKALPRGSVIWLTRHDKDDDGIVWHNVIPAMIYKSGKDCSIIGSEESYSFDNTIDDMIPDPVLKFWDKKPDDNQIIGITEEEYNSILETGKIKFQQLAAAITSKGMTFKVFCKSSILGYDQFWDAITGEREFTRDEMLTIIEALRLTDDQTREIFFSDCVA